MKRINSKKDLPKEFDLEKYECLSSLSDKDLFRQLNSRKYPFDDSLDKNWDVELSTYYLKHGGALPIQYDCSDPFEEYDVEMPDEYYEFNGGKEFLNKYQENIDKSRRLSNGYGIGGLRRYTVMCLARENDEFGERKGKSLIIDDDEAKEILHSGDENHGLLMARMTDSVNMISNHELYLEVDLDTPDDLLVEDFKRLLPIWRSELGLDSVDVKINNAWEVVRKKVLEYRVIPFLDLTIWANINKFTIPHGVMAVALFPDGDRDGFGIAQTVKPFVEKLMQYESIEKLRREISK
ncbi:DUF6387 family protein [Serratia ureilytica]|uniref:DUF6387 family protein n=1 Tax=Serratia ureilytica TaxID=300181 RepID=UPI00191CCF76|nr:DUF6387 family protein [Serratia ureilytica]MBL0880397.1 hypothetical protein [Serratia ureilytica]MDN2472655.1 hypothetical protein [Serratia ureilytica]